MPRKRADVQMPLTKFNPLLKPHTNDRKTRRTEQQFPKPLVIAGGVLDRAHVKWSQLVCSRGSKNHCVAYRSRFRIHNQGVDLAALKLRSGRFNYCVDTSPAFR